MRSTEFLVEYNRNITIKHINIINFLKALIHDDSVNFPAELKNLRSELTKIFNSEYENLNQKKLLDAAEAILGVIETLDPTPNNKFVPWLARMYANGSLKFEDINRNNLLVRFEEAKRLNLVPLQYKDINKLKSYYDFEEMMQEYVLPNMEDAKNDDRDVKAEKIFEDNDVLVVIPKNEAAACKYGKGTRWCTAATQGENYFNHYNEIGSLYILIPKHPKYKGEKYQLHFKTNQYMNEKDRPISLHYLLFERFPQLRKLFFKIEPELEYVTNIFDADTLEKLFLMVKKKIIKIIENLYEKEKNGNQEIENSEPGRYGDNNLLYKKLISFVERELQPTRLYDERLYELMKDVRTLPIHMAKDLYYLVNNKGFYTAEYIIYIVRKIMEEKRLRKISDNKWKIEEKTNENKRNIIRV
jgi:hypothetical protein